MASWTKRMLVLAALSGAAAGSARVLGAGRHAQWIAELGVLAGLLVVCAIIDFFSGRHLQRAIADSHDLYEQLRREQFSGS